MKLNGRSKLSFPRDVVFRAYRDRLPEVVPFLPNVRAIDVQSRHEDGPRTRLLNVWHAKGEIPSVAQKYVKPEMLAWTDHAEWDESALACTWNIETHALPGVVECEGRTLFHAEADGGTTMEIDGELYIHMENAPVPRLLGATFRPLLERIIVTALTPNLIKVGDAVEKFLIASPRPR